MTATMSPVRAHIYRLGEFHRFQAAGAQFIYLVPRPHSSMRPLPHGRGSAAELNRDRKGAEHAVTGLVPAGAITATNPGFLQQFAERKAS